MDTLIHAELLIRGLLTILDAADVDGSGGDAIVTLRPKAGFAPLLSESPVLTVQPTG